MSKNKFNCLGSARQAPRSIRAGLCRKRVLSTLVKNVIKSRSLLWAAAVSVLLPATADAQVVLTDIGTTPPTPGAYDIYQLINGGGEPPGLEGQWTSFALRASASPKLWMDAYLAAFARAGGYRMVTTDVAFRQFPGLDVLVLGGDPP